MKRSLILVAPLLLVAAACRPADPTRVTAQNAPTIGDDLASNSEEFVGLFEENGGDTTIAPCLGGGEFIPDANNDFTDADIDLIPVHVGTTYNNCVILGINVNGYVWREDSDPSTAGFNWAAAREDLTLSVGTTTSGHDVTVQATAAGGTYGLDVDGARTAEWRDGNVDHTAAQSLTWAMDFTPDGTWDPFTEAFPAGTIEYSGSWAFEVDDASNSATLDTLTPVHISPTCASYVDAGSLRLTFAQDGGEVTITVDWSACDVHTVSFTL